MPNSLRSRLKNLVHKGILSQKDLDRIEIISIGKEKQALQAAHTIKEYCKSIPSNCDGCIFSGINNACKLNNPNHLPETWEIGEV